MRPITLDYSNILSFVSQKEIDHLINKNQDIIRHMLDAKNQDSDELGWADVDACANRQLVEHIEEKAKEIRENADVFLLIGVGGSNQGARAVIKALQPSGNPEILYAGNNLSPVYMHRILGQLKGKSVYANIIAKNFATLEPGICFRVIRKYMEETYGEEEAAKRIIATGSPHNSSLEQLADHKGYMFLPFPLDIGGRYSVLSAVGLLPIAVSGADIRALINGAKDMAVLIHARSLNENLAVSYGAIRNVLLAKGYKIEMLAYFEPLLVYFSKWWAQLFGESEGKDGKGIFPTACAFTEDLHSLGQYIQDGQRIIFETFIHLEESGASLIIEEDKGAPDDFDYLDGKDFASLNQTAYEATVKAHVEGGVPAMVLNVPALTPYYMGQLFYFFEYACYISGFILGVNPFDQPGVEAYKINMFASLGQETL